MEFWIVLVMVGVYMAFSLWLKRTETRLKMENEYRRFQLEDRKVDLDSLRIENERRRIEIDRLSAENVARMIDRLKVEDAEK